MAAPGEDWRSISETLSTGGRGLPQRMSLPALITLHGNPGLRNRKERRLSVAQILVWADRYHRRWKRWPTRLSGSIQGSRGETWQGLDYALQYGTRGLAGGSSLSRTLTAHRDLRRGYKLPKLSIGTILQWADAHHRRTGTWPVVSGTPIPESPGDTWHRVASALVFGNRGLPGGMSLAQLLAKHRGKRNAKRLPSLTIEQILAWADAYFRRKGAWPNAYKGEVIPKSRGETWLRVHNALAEGLRGLPGGSSLARLLAEQREVRTRRYSPRLTENRILQWADAHYKRWKTWPTRSSGVVDDDPTESWDRIDSALKSGLRGLQTNSSLCKLLARYRR